MCMDFQNMPDYNCIGSPYCKLTNICDNFQNDKAANPVQKGTYYHY